MVTFYEFRGILYRHLYSEKDAVWVINYDAPCAPYRVAYTAIHELIPATIPDSFLDESDISEKRRASLDERKLIMRLLINDKRCIIDERLRRGIVSEIARQNGISERTIRRLYYAYLAKGERGLLPATRVSGPRRQTDTQKKMVQALNTYFFSPKKMSLKSTYEMMLLDSYMDTAKRLDEARPTFSQFKYYFYKNKNVSREIISRHGYGDFQKNHRPLFGKGDSGIEFIGAYEMDATEADIYIVSRYDRKPIGRPIVYLAVDIASRLIAGIYVGLEGTSDSVLSCLSNAACDKVEYCRGYGIEIKKEMWPSMGLPSVIYTDRGRDFTSDRVKELCQTFGMEITSLPAFRPDLKGYVEKAFDCVQKKYKPLLQGKGVIDLEQGERGAPDYYQQATVDLDEFTKIIIQCVLYYNSAHILKNFIRLPEMAQADVSPLAANLWQWYWKTGRRRIIVADEESTRLMLLTRADAYLTRRGVEFKDLYYQSEELFHEFVHAGVAGKKKVVVAFNPLNDDKVYLVEDGVYYPLTLTLASGKMKNLSYEEVRILQETEASVQQAHEDVQIYASVVCAGEIKDIVESADTGALHAKNDTTRGAMNMKRQKEKELYKKDE